MCKSWCELILGIIILVFALLDSWMYSKWIVIIAAIVLIVHSFVCKKCFSSMPMKPMKKR